MLRFIDSTLTKIGDRECGSCEESESTPKCFTLGRHKQRRNMLFNCQRRLQTVINLLHGRSGYPAQYAQDEGLLISAKIVALNDVIGSQSRLPTRAYC